MNFKEYNFKVVKSSLIFQYVNFIQLALSGVLLVPFYLKYIPLTTYGLWLGVSSLISNLVILDPGFSTYILTETPKLLREANRSRFNSLVNSALLITLVLVLLLSVVFGVIIFSVSFEDHQSQELVHGMVFLFMSLLLSFFSSIFIALNTVYGETQIVGIINSISGFGGIFLTLFLLSRNFGVTSIGITMLCRSIFILFMNIILITKREKFRNFITKVDVEVIKFDFIQTFHVFKGKMGNVLSTEYLNPVLASVSPIALVKLKMSRTLGDLSKFLIDRPFYALMPLISSLNLQEDREKIIMLLRISSKLLAAALSSLFFQLIFSNNLFVKYWVGIENYIGTMENLVLSIFIVLLVLNQVLTYLLYGLGRLKEINKVILYQGFISVFFLSAAYLFNAVIMTYLFIITAIEIYVAIVLLFKLGSLLKINSNSLYCTFLICIKVLLIGVSALAFASVIDIYFCFHEIIPHLVLFTINATLLFRFDFIRLNELKEVLNN
jgi:hypothetical protein